MRNLLRSIPYTEHKRQRQSTLFSNDTKKQEDSMSKRSRLNNDESYSVENSQVSLDDKILSSDLNRFIQATTANNSAPSSTHAYHLSVCGSILYSPPTNSPADIFSFLRHSKLDAFRRSLDIYHQDIIRMRNDLGQTVLHVLAIHAHQYLWIRLLMLRGCDMCAQDVDGYTAAHYAVERDDVEMLKALTLRFHSQVKPLPEEQITAIHERCCQALALRERNGLTVFMLACQRESIKCLDYLIEMNVNDSNLEDTFGDTCLHYAVGRRNLQLVEKLITRCQANVSGGQQMRPSVLDVLQHNRAQQKPFDRVKDDDIEQLLLSYKARNRCSIRRVFSKRKGSNETEESVTSNLASLSIDVKANERTETAHGHARLGASLEAKGDLDGAQESFQQAMACTPDDTLDWATYALHSARIYMVRGANEVALDLLQKALVIRIPLERESEEIDQIQRTITMIHQPSA